MCHEMESQRACLAKAAALLGLLSGLFQILESGGVWVSYGLPKGRTELKRGPSDIPKLLLKHFPFCLMTLHNLLMGTGSECP